MKTKMKLKQAISLFLALSLVLGMTGGVVSAAGLSLTAGEEDAGVTSDQEVEETTSEELFVSETIQDEEVNNVVNDVESDEMYDELEDAQESTSNNNNFTSSINSTATGSAPVTPTPSVNPTPTGPMGPFTDEKTKIIYNINPDSTASIIGYGGGVVDGLEIPDKFDNHVIVSINDRAFYECGSIVGNLRLPSSLTRIGSEAFFMCDGITGELILPDGLTNIGASAFYGCNGLTGTLKLPEMLTSIGRNAFYNCGFTGDLRIPESLTTIGESAFLACSGLTGSLTLPSTLESIGESVFSHCGFTGELILPENLKSIGAHAFRETNFSGSLEIPKGVEYIGTYAFAYGHNFNGDLILHEGLKRLGEGAFFQCGFTGKLNLPEGLLRIDYQCFESCPGFSGELVIPETVSLVKDAFTNTNFSSINNKSSAQIPLPSKYWYSKTSHSIISNGYIGKEVAVKADKLKTSLDEHGDTIKVGEKIQLKAEIENLEDEDIKFSWSLDNTNVASIDENNILSVLMEGWFNVTVTAFDDLTVTYSFNSISTNPTPSTSPDTPPSAEGDYLYKILDDGTAELVQYTGIKSGDIIMPDEIGGHKVTSIGPSLFYGNRGFEGTIKLPKDLVYIKNDAFYECSGLTGELILPESLEYIGNNAFCSCNGLTGELKLPENLSYIGSGAFSLCDGFIGTLKIPSKISDIKANAFSFCSGFIKLELPSELNSIGDSSFEGCSFSGKLVLPQGLTKIDRFAFSECYRFTGNLSIPSGVEHIGYAAFRSCSGFTGNLILQKGLKRIDEYAFANCIGMNGKLELPVGLTRIGANAFNGCGFTGDLTLPDGLLRIDNGAFNYCYSLNGNLVIPNSVTTIGGSVFEDTNFSTINNKSSISVLIPLNRRWYSLANHALIPDGILGTDTAVNANQINISTEGDIHEIAVGDTLQFKATIKNLESENIKFTWDVSDEEVAKIDSNGLLTALSEGDVDISVTAFGDLIEYSYVSVVNSSGNPPTKPTVTPTKVPTITESPTPTDSPSTTITPTPSDGPSTGPTGTPGEPNQTPSVTPSVSPAPSTSPEATPSVTPEASPSLTPGATPTTVPEPTPSQAPTLTPGAVTSPDGITVEPALGTKKVDITWVPVPGVDGYVIYVKDETTGEFKKLKTIHGADSTSFSKSMGERGGTYTFKIQTFKKGEDGSNIYEDLGDEISVKLYEYDKSKKPKVKANTKTGSKRVFFQWEKVEGADGYLIYKYNPSTKKYDLLDKVSGEDTTSFDFANGLKNGETYSFRVKAFAVTADGKKQVDGKASTTIKVTTPPTKAKKPSAVSNTKNEASISWPKVKNAKGYRVYRSTSQNGKYIEVETTSGGNSLTFTDKNLKSGKVYFYKVRAYSENPDGTKAFGQISAAKKVRIK